MLGWDGTMGGIVGHHTDNSLLGFRVYGGVSFRFANLAARCETEHHMHSVLSVTCAVFERPPAATGGGAAGGEGPTQKGASCGGGGEGEAACMQVEKDQRRKVCPVGGRRGDHPYLPSSPSPPSLTSPSLFTLTCPLHPHNFNPPPSPAPLSGGGGACLAQVRQVGKVWLTETSVALFKRIEKCGIGVGRPFFFHKMLPYQWVPDYQLVETREERCAICDSR